MDLPKPSPRHSSPTISPLQSRTPFFLPKRSNPTASSPFSPRNPSSFSRASALSSRLRSLLPSRCGRWLPRSKARFVLLLMVVGTLAMGLLVSMSILSLDLPPIDEYDQPNRDLKKEDISRSFEEPDYSLLSSPQPHSIGCPQSSSPTAPLLFLGIFSAPDKVVRRNLIRNETKPDWPTDLVDFKFIFGRPSAPEQRRLLSEEQEEHGDIVIVDSGEGIDEGKTHAYFEWVAEKREGEKPKFVMKADDDTLLVMPNIISAFSSLDCSKNVYWGTSCGITYHFPFYFRGLGYALSWPLVEWIGKADIDPAHATKIEDARTSQWLRNLDPVTDPVQFIDMGWMMGDYNQLDVTVETVALHWLKWDEWLIEQATRIKKIWADAGRPYKAGQGVDPAISIEKGKHQPEAAAKEKERQKAAGWDV